MSLCFLTFSIVFQNTELFISLKKFSSKSFLAFLRSSMFISKYGCSQAYWFNLRALCIFFSFNPWSNICSRAFMRIRFVFMRVRFCCCTDYRLQSFSSLSNFILSGKNGKSLHSSCSSLEYLTLSSNIYPSSLFSSRSCMNSWSNVNLSFLYLKPSTCNSSYIAHLNKLLTSHTIYHEIWGFFVWIMIFHVLVVALCVSMCDMTHSISVFRQRLQDTDDINISQQLQLLLFFFFFFSSMLTMLINPGVDKM